MRQPLTRLVFRYVSLLAALGLIAAACGQKPGVHIATGSGQVVGGEGTELLIDPETGEVISPGEAGGSLEGGDAGGTTTTRRSGSGGGDGGSAQAATSQPGDTDGVTDNEILVGFHAPLTGAAPVPLTDIRLGVNLYRQWLDDKGVTIHGRKLRTVFRNDKYNPADAVRECRDMVEAQKVFLLVGGAGTDQIVACANYAARRGVPYLSAGVTQNTLNRLHNYFAFSQSYPQQGKPLAEMIARFDAGPRGGKVLVDRCPDSSAGQQADVFCSQSGPAGNAKVGMVYSDTDGFYDARDEFLRQWKAVSGKDVDGTFAITKFSISSGDANTLVQDLKGKGFDVVYILTSPTNWLTILRVAEGQRYAPRWVGVGLTKGVNLVPAAACGPASRNSFEFSLFLNPWYAVDNDNAGQFKEAWRSHGDGSPPESHDIAWGLWGGSVVQHALFDAVGRDLTRSGFINTVQGLKNLKAPDNTNAGNIIDVYSVLNYSPSNHFGASQAHLIYGDCNQSRWLDIPGKQFVSGF